MLHGRAKEQAAIRDLLDRARAGTGGALVLRGEPGIGKTALLDDAAATTGVRVLRTAGVEPEQDLGHAATHRLLRPILDDVDDLPPAQADALNTVFGRSRGPTPDRFLVALAMLTLLSDAAPVICVVDDAHWIDQPSLDALAFVARRLDAEPIALLIATRTDDRRSLAGLPELPLAGLDRASALALLSERDIGSDADVLLRTAAGNPLALRELRPGPLGEPLPLVDRLQEAFLDQLRGYDDEARRLLLLVAADGTGDLAVLRRAAGRSLEDLADVVSRHPLVRSAVYHGATPAERRAAHRALADVLDDDRRAWHLGQAADGPDETIAAELERAAERAIRRAGPAAAASAYARAAELSPADADRARRLGAAAAASWQAGDAVRAIRQLDLAEQHGHTDRLLRALIELRAGNPPDALRLLRPVMSEALQAHPVEWLVLFGEASYHAADVDAWTLLGDTLEQLPMDGPDQALLRLARAVNRVRRGVPDQVPDNAAFDDLTDPVGLCWAGGMLFGTGDIERGRWLRKRAMQRAYAVGATGTLAWVLQSVVADEMATGQFRAAEAHADEGQRHAGETGQPNLGFWFRAMLATLAGLRGREAEARELAESVLAETVGRQLAAVTSQAHRALGLLDLAAGRAEAAIRHFRPDEHPGLLHQNVPDLVEAAYRIDRPELVTEPLNRFVRWAEATGSPGVLALAARCRGLAGSEADFQRALELPTDSPFDLARTRLLYGEFLRRARRKSDARTELRAAYDSFNQLGAIAWAARARDELRAAGETAVDGTPDALSTLTAQELRIASAVAEGATNREIAAQLFLSTRTVDYHLRKVFQKLGISSRIELAGRSF